VSPSPAEAERSRLFETEIDLAYFAVNLGWSVSDYYESTPVQRMFIRKEIERQTVQRSDLLKDAVQVAVSNVMGRRKNKLWLKTQRKAWEEPVRKREISAIQEQMNKRVPWTPWNGVEVSHG
jgi:hypothetical protein